MAQPLIHRLAGCRFGSLVVLCRERCPRGRMSWKCLCDCGNTRYLDGKQLVSGRSVSCGCKRLSVMRTSNLRHGGSGTREHDIWRGILKRCGNTRHKNYAGRGIGVCERWRTDFTAFLADMGPCPPSMSIDRIDNDRGYEPGNCRWATRAEQNRNRRANVYVFFRGQRMVLTDACAIAGQPYARVRDRIKTLGWTPERALTQPKWGERSA